MPPGFKSLAQGNSIKGAQTRDSIDKNLLPALSPKRKLDPVTPSDKSKSTQRKQEDQRVNNNTTDVPATEN